MGIRAGRNRHRFELQDPIEDESPDGDKETRYRTLRRIWGDIIPQRSQEFLNAQSMNANITTVIKVRYEKGITSRHRLKLGSRIFNIDGPPINVEERNIELVLRCIEEEDPDG